MAVKLENLLAELPEVTRNSTSGALDNTKRTRGLNRVLQDLQDFADWTWTRRKIKFDFIDGVSEYSLQNFLGAVCLDNDGETEIPDFKSHYDLRVPNQGKVPFAWEDPKDIRDRIRRGRMVNEYGIDGDLLVVNYPAQSALQINNCDSLTDDGAWSVSGNASNLTLDEVSFTEGSASLNFDANGTSLVIQNTTMDEKDLTDFENISYWTFDLDLPDVDNFASITLRFGDDLATDYWEVVATTRADGQDLEVGTNKFAFKWADAVLTGSPDPATVSQVRITIAYSSTVNDTDFRLDDIRVAKSVPMEFQYYSLAMVETENGDLQLEFNPDDLTMNDELRGGTTCRRTVMTGGVYECFKMIGGKSERDRTDNYKEYQDQKMVLLKRAGRRVKQEKKTLNFPGRH